MQHHAPRDARKTVASLQKAFLPTILVATAAGVVLGHSLDTALEYDVGWLVAASLAALGVSEAFMVPFVVLPSIAKNPQATVVTVSVVGFVFANAIAIYGVVAAVVTSVGLVAVPFGILALIVWGMVKNFLSGHYRDTLSGSGEL